MDVLEGILVTLKDLQTRIEQLEEREHQHSKMYYAGTEYLGVYNGELVVNEDSNDVSFRVETNGNTHTLAVGGATNTVGIGAAAVAGTELKVTGEFEVTSTSLLTGAVSIAGAATAGKELTVNGDAHVTATSQLDGIVGIGGAAAAGWELKVTGDAQVTGKLNISAQSEVTIATGVITITKSYHTVDTEGDGATDDLVTINGGAEGDLLILRANNASRTVVCKDGTGNLLLAGDCTLDDSADTITLISHLGTYWIELARSNNA